MHEQHFGRVVRRTVEKDSGAGRSHYQEGIGPGNRLRPLSEPRLGGNRSAAVRPGAGRLDLGADPHQGRLVEGGAGEHHPDR